MLECLLDNGHKSYKFKIGGGIQKNDLDHYN